MIEDFDKLRERMTALQVERDKHIDWIHDEMRKSIDPIDDELRNIKLKMDGLHLLPCFGGTCNRDNLKSCPDATIAACWRRKMGVGQCL